MKFCEDIVKYFKYLKLILLIFLTIFNLYIVSKFYDVFDILDRHADDIITLNELYIKCLQTGQNTCKKSGN